MRSAAHSEGTNRNAATRNATAPIVSFIDADDVPARDRVEVIEAAFHRYPELDYVLHHHDVFYKEQAHAVGHDWWLHVTSLPTRHRWARSNIRTNSERKIKYQSDARTELFYDIGQTRSLRKKYGRKGHDFAYGYCFNWDSPSTNLMHNGWPSFRRHLIDHVQFRDNLRRGADVIFCNAVMARFEANGLSALLGYHRRRPQSLRASPTENRTASTQTTCPTTNTAIVSALPELPRALAERHAEQMAQSRLAKQMDGHDTAPSRPAAAASTKTNIVALVHTIGLSDVNFGLFASPVLTQRILKRRSLFSFASN